MRKRLSYLLVVAVFVSMLSLSGCGGGGGTTKSEANPYEAANGLQSWQKRWGFSCPSKNVLKEIYLSN